jgi:hypothetical protein
MRIARIAAFALVGLATTAIAKEPAEDKVVCKRQNDADTGSHFAAGKKVCMKKSEWKELEDSADRTMQNIRDHGGMNPNGGAPTTGGPG